MVALRQEDVEPIVYAGVLTKDATLRRQFFGDAVLAHPAKQHLPQLIHLLHRFAVHKGVLLDPMGGTGTAMLATAPLYGMDVVTNELAAHFITLQAGAWKHFQTVLPMLNNAKRTPQQITRLKDNGMHERHGFGKHSQLSVKSLGYEQAPQNIGNLRGNKYLDSMAQVWQQCAAIMRPGAVLHHEGLRHQGPARASGRTEPRIADGGRTYFARDRSVENPYHEFLAQHPAPEIP